MIGLIVLLSALALGVAAVRRLALPLYRFEYPALAIVLGLVGWTWLSFLTSLVLPYHASLPLTIGLASAATVLLWWRAPAARHVALPGKRGATMIWWVFTAISSFVLATLYYTHDLITKPSGVYSAGSTWADYGLHASLISHFAASTRLPLDFPIAAGTHITYPFLADLLTAWLVRGGWSLHLALWLPNTLLAIALLQLFIGFGTRLVGRLGAAVSGLTIALLSGSIAGIDAFITDWHSSGQGLAQFIGHLPRDYTALDSYNAHFTNLVTDILLPQHSFLFGFGLVAAGLIMLYEGRRHSHRGWIITAGVVAGLLPLSHPHSFIVLGSIIASLAVADMVHRRTWRSPYLLAGFIALVMAAPQVGWQMFANGHGTGGHASIGWMYDGSTSIVTYWWRNYGVAGPVLAALPVALWWHRPWRRYLVWYAPVWLIFVFANLYAIQPFSYDNLKLIIYVWIFGLMLVAGLVAELASRWRGLIVPLLPIVLLTIASGSLAVAYDWQNSEQFASPDDMALAAWAQSNTTPSTVFATTDLPNQPLATLAGRELVMGYRGWLYNFNLDYTTRAGAISAALIGNTAALAPYHASYLVVASNEPSYWTIDAAQLAKLPLDYHNATWTVYRLAP